MRDQIPEIPVTPEPGWARDEGGRRYRPGVVQRLLTPTDAHVVRGFVPETDAEIGGMYAHLRDRGMGRVGGPPVDVERARHQYFETRWGMGDNFERSVVMRRHVRCEDCGRVLDDCRCLSARAVKAGRGWLRRTFGGRS